MDIPKKGMGWLFIRKDGNTHQIMPGMMFVGREECDIILQSASADKRHAVIFYDSSNQEIHIKDLNSLTGTYVNGVRIPEQTYVRLKHLDTLRFGYGPDIFHIQDRNIGSTSRKELENRMCLSWSEKTDSYRDKHSPSLEKMTSASQSQPNKTVESKRNKLHDSLEDLQQSSYPDISTYDNSISSGETCTKSMSPAFSSLTFKRSSSRNSSTTPEGAIPTSENSLTGEMKGDGRSENDSFETCNQSPSVDSSFSPVSDKPQPTEADSKQENIESTGPLVMAFTVAFDNPTPKKKFSIKDSISKYAPKKGDSERINRSKQDKGAESVGNKLPSAENTEVQLRKKIPTACVEEICVREPAECGWKLSPGWKATSEKNEPKLSHGATYLIQKMFKGNKANDLDRKDQILDRKNNSLLHNTAEDTSPVKKVDDPVSGNEDARSDTGTYTVDEELDSKTVADARKKIDEVFGVPSSGVFCAVEESPVMKENRSERMTPPKEDNSKDLANRSLGKEVVAPPRTKRRLPTPPVQKTDIATSIYSEKPYSSNCSLYSASSSPEAGHFSLQKENLSTKDLPPFEKHSAAIKEKTSFLTQSAKSPRNSRLTADNLEFLQSSGTVSKKSSNSSCNISDLALRRLPPSMWRRTQWALSGSDMDLDQIKVETSSVLSDVSASTEPPSVNTLPPSIRSDTGPQMKFNRAFALRRARLGLETDLPPATRNIASKENKSVKTVSSSSVPPALSRQDGGRFSLRLPKSTSKASGSKNAVKPAAGKAIPVAPSQKFGHRRLDSDPAKTAFLRKGIDHKMSLPPNKSQIKGPGYQSSFQRAASFANNDGTGESPSAIQGQFYEQKPDRQSTISLRGKPQVMKSKMGKADEDDLLSRENRISLRPAEKADLSALDNLVIQATHQLSVKLKTIAHNLLAKERDKFTEDSSERLMIDEVLPRVSDNSGTTCSSCGERGISQDLANILKNLKRVEQSLEVLTVVIDEERVDPRRYHHHNHHHHSTESGDTIYVVNV